MRWKNLYLLSVLTLLFFCFLTVDARSYHITNSKQHFSTGQAYINFDDSITPLTFSTMYKEGSTNKQHFNSTWIKTTVDMTINAFFSNDWFNYSTSNGVQQIYDPEEPNAVYFDGLSQTEGETWSYSDETITVTPSGTDVSIYWGEIEEESNGQPEADSAGGGLQTTGPPAKFMTTLIIIALTVLCLFLVWLNDATKKRGRW